MSARGKKGGGSNVTPLREFAPFRFDLERGDGVELAEHLLRDLQGERAVKIKFDRDAFWKYEAARGVWEKVPDEAPTRLLALYAGKTVPGPGGAPRALRLRAGDIVGAVAIAQKLAADPGFFNDAPAGVAFANGFVVLVTEPDPDEPARAVARPEIRPHSPEHRATFALPCAYDPAAAAPRWERFLQEIWTPPEEPAASAEARAAGASDRGARVRAIEEWIGAALLGEAVTYQICLVLLGNDGANGKSTLLKTLRALFPPDTVRSIAPHAWARGFQLAQLAGARLNVVNELPEADIAGGDLFKAVISGDAVSAEHKYTDPFTLLPRAGHLFACNGLPGTRDQSGGYWRRWLVLPFERTFKEHEQDRGLEAALAAELAGIAARVLAAAGKLRARGYLITPDASAEAKELWQLETDTVRQWVRDCAEPDPAAHTKLPDLYPTFKGWATANGHVPMASNKFGAALERLGHRKRSKLDRWYPLRVLPAAEARWGPRP